MNLHLAPKIKFSFSPFSLLTFLIKYYVFNWERCWPTDKNWRKQSNEDLTIFNTVSRHDENSKSMLLSKGAWSREHIVFSERKISEVPFGHQIAVLHFVRFSAHGIPCLVEKSIYWILGSCSDISFAGFLIDFSCKKEILELGMQVIYMFRRNQEYCSFPEWGSRVLGIIISNDKSFNKNLGLKIFLAFLPSW